MVSSCSLLTRLNSEDDYDETEAEYKRTMAMVERLEDSLNKIGLSTKDNTVADTPPQTKPRGRTKTVQMPEGEYEGEWKKGAPNGYGTMHYRNQDSYSGYWVDGVRKGAGRLFSLSDKITICGIWDGDSYSGEGGVIYHDGTGFELSGTWVNAKELSTSFSEKGKTFRGTVFPFEREYYRYGPSLNNGRLSWSASNYGEGQWEKNTYYFNSTLDDLKEGTVSINTEGISFVGKWKNGIPYDGALTLNHRSNNKSFTFKGKVLEGEPYGHLTGDLNDQDDLFSPTRIGWDKVDCEMSGYHDMTGVFQGNHTTLKGRIMDADLDGNVTIVHDEEDSAHNYKTTLDTHWEAGQLVNGKGHTVIFNKVTDEYVKEDYSLEQRGFMQLGLLFDRGGEKTVSFSSWSAIAEPLTNACFDIWKEHKKAETEAKTLKNLNYVKGQAGKLKREAITLNTLAASYNNTVQKNPYIGNTFPIVLRIERIDRDSLGWTLGIKGEYKYALISRSGSQYLYISTNDDSFAKLSYPATLYIYAKFLKKEIHLPSKYSPRYDEYIFEEAVYLGKK